MAKSIVSADVKFNEQAFKAAEKASSEDGLIHRFAINGHKIAVGLMGPEAEAAKIDYHGRATSMSVAESAYFHEFGLGVPERSWLRSWFDSNNTELKNMMISTARRAMAAKANKGSADVFYQSFALRTKNMLKQWLAHNENQNPLLSPRTLNERLEAGIDGDVPLVATKQTLNAIQSSVDGQIAKSGGSSE